MKGKGNPVLQEIEWQDIRQEVKLVNNELAAIIDRLSPTKRYKLIKASYNFGDLILKDGVANLPSTTGKPSPITDLSSDAKLKTSLSYSSIPLFLTLKNTNEVYIDTGSRIVPLNIAYPGSMLGLFESMDFLFKQPTLPKWSVTAGGRCLFMLPKITEVIGFKKLRMHYGLSSTTHIKELSDHWALFKAIASHQNFTQNWQNEVLFFSKEWLSHNSDPAWSAFYHYLMKCAWRQAQFAISKIDIGINWNYFTSVIAAKNLKPTLYLADQVRHIMYITSGLWPGFRPVDDSQQIAPITGLQEAFTEVYQLKNYYPTIMSTHMLDANSKLPVYYSLFYPILLEGSPQSTRASTIMLNLRDIKLLLDILKRSYNTNSKFNYDFIKKAQFEFFHVEPDKYSEIKQSQLILKDDPAFLETSHFRDRIFCSTSSFWRGCIRISMNN